MASVQVNLELSPEEQLRDLMARTSQTRHPEESVWLGTAVAVPGGTINETTVLVQVNNEYTRKTRMVRYRRADLTQAFGFLDLSIFMGAPPWEVEDLVEQINQLGYTQLLYTELELDPEPVPLSEVFRNTVLHGLDYVPPAADAAAPDTPPPYTAIRLRARLGSFLYVGRFWVNVMRNPET